MKNIIFIFSCLLLLLFIGVCQFIIILFFNATSTEKIKKRQENNKRHISSFIQINIMYFK